MPLDAAIARDPHRGFASVAQWNLMKRDGAALLGAHPFAYAVTVRIRPDRSDGKVGPVARAAAFDTDGLADLYRSLFDRMLEGFALHEIITDESGSPVDYRFVEVNSAFEQLTGLKREDIIGRTVLEVLPGTEPEWIAAYGRVALTGEPHAFRMRAASLERDYDVHAYSPGPGMFATFFVDVTESERVARELERDEHLHRAVVEASTDGFWMMDTQGVLLEVNESLSRITGYARSELVGMSVGDLEASETPAQTAETMASIREIGSGLFETTLRAKDGTVIPVEVSVSFQPIETGRYFAFFRDIAKVRRSEYLIRARAELLDLEKEAGIDDILRSALDKAELLTGSSIGFFHLVDPDQNNLTLQTWSTNTLATMCSAEGKGQHYPVDEAGVWTESVRTRETAIHNDYEHMQGKKGMPEGHAPVVRELVVPVVRGGAVVALMGVGNKTTDYTEDDVLPVEAIANMAADVALHSRTQEEYERFFDLVPDLVVIASADGRFRRVNSAWDAALGYTAAEMLAKPFLDFVHPQDRDATEKVFASETHGEYVRGFVNRYLAKDGTYHWLEWSASPVGEEGLMFAVARDITASREAEESLRRSEERFRRLFDNMVEGIAYCRMIYEGGVPTDWVYLEVNDAFERQTGLTGAGGRLASDVIPGIRESDPELLERYSRVATTGVPERFEAYVEALGAWFDLRVYSPEKGYFVAVFDVVTARKRLEEAAAEREERLQALLDNAPYGAHMYELMAGDRLVFIGYNARAVEMLGVDHANRIGMTLEEAFPGNVGSETPEQYRRVAREGGTWAVEQYSYDDESGITGVFEVYAFSFGTNRVSVFFRDVTELRRTELELQRSDTQLRGTVAELANAVRTLRALSACNEALVRAETEQQLLQDVCDIAVEQGGYRMAFVGYAEHDQASTIKPMAASGEGADFLETAVMSWGPEGPNADTPAALAIRDGVITVVDSIATDERQWHWKDRAAARGLAAVAAFPLTTSDGITVGAILFNSGNDAVFGEEEISLLTELSSDLSFGIETLRARTARADTSAQLAVSNERLEGLLRQVTVALGRVVEARDPYTSGHEERVATLARQIAVEMGLPEDEADGIEMTGLVHDIGKLSVPAEILTKPSALSDIERRLIREHSMSGYEILKGISFVWPVADIVMQHHERMDGSGYPQGLVGDQILLPARILAVADTVEAMASHRPYRPALGLEAAIAEIGAHPEHYDPAVVAACVRLFEAGAIAM